MKTGRKFLSSTLLAAAAMSFYATSVNAADLTWAGTDDNNSWNYTDTNWSNGSTFSSGDNAIFDDSAESSEVYIEDEITAGTITISSGSYIFTISEDGSLSATTGLTINEGASLVITGDGTFTTDSSSSSTTTIDGDLTISGRETTFSELVNLGQNTGSSGTLTIYGGETIFGANVSVGNSGTGALTISGGSTTFSGGYVFLGCNSGSLGTMEISGGTTTFENEVRVGDSGTGKLTISGGKTTFSDSVYLGYESGSSGTLTIGSVDGTGGTTEFSSKVYVGYISGSSGELTITGGETTFSGFVYLGYYSGSSGTMEISGGKTTFSRFVDVGEYGTGKLTISGGETTFIAGVSLGFGYIGYNSGPSGELTISGGKTTFEGVVEIGCSSGSSGTMEISGGTTTFENEVYVGRGSTGTMEISGGTTTFGGIVYVGNSGTGSLTITGGETTFRDWVEIGYYSGSSGELTISGGKTTFSGYVHLGYNSGSSGTLTISGGNTTFGNEVCVGRFGTGKLKISDDAETTFSSYVYLGWGSGSSGTMEITGGETSFGGTVYVGYSGTGALTISGGETTFGGNVYLGYKSGSSGSTMEISGGNTTFKSSVTVATEGSLSLTGGTVTLSEAISNSGTVTVSGNVVFVLDNLTDESGTYTLITDGGMITGWDSLTYKNFEIDGSAVSSARQIEFTETDGSIIYHETAVAADLVWAGTGTTEDVWSDSAATDSPKDWLNGTKADAFYNGDNVTFDGTATSQEVTISGAVIAGTVTVTGEEAEYTFSFDKDNGVESSLTADSLTITGEGASLKITGPGSFTTSSTATIDGSLTIDSTGTATFGGDVYVGYLGTGSLTISGEKTTFEGAVLIGDLGNGTVVISGDGTTFKGEVYVGGYGNGELKITSGSTEVSGAVTVATNSSLTVSENGSLTASSADIFGTLTVDGTGASLTASSATVSGLLSTAGTTKIDSVTVDLTGTLSITGGSLEITDGLTSAGTVSVIGSGSLSLDGTIDLSSAIENSGTVTVGENVVFVLDNLTATGDDTTTYTIISGEGTIEGWGTLDESNFSLNGKGLGRSTVNVETDGQVTITYVAAENLVWNGTSSSNVWTNDGDEIWLNGEEQDMFIAGDNVTFGSDGEKSVSVVGAIVAGTITVTGSGYTFTFSENSSVTADSLTIDSGASLTLAGSGELTTSSATVSGTLEITSGEATITSVEVSSEGTLKISGGTTTADSIDVAGSLELTGGELTVKTIALSDGSSGSFSGGILNISEITGDGSLSFGNGLTVNLYDTTSLSLTSDITLSGSVTFNAEDGESIELSGTLSGSGKLVKDGDGTLTLSGDNTFSGGATISSGTIVAQSDTALGSGSIAINDGATLEIPTSREFTNTTSGNGTLSITNDAIVSFTKSVGVQTLKVTSDATLSGSTTLTHSNAQLVLAGTLALDASAGEQVSFTNGGTVVLESTATLDLSGISPTGVKPLSDSSEIGPGSNITIFSGATVEGDIEAFLATDSTLSALSNDYAIVYDPSKGLTVMILESGNVSSITSGVRLHDGIGSDFISAIISDDDLDFGTGFESADDLQSLSNPIVKALATGNISEASKMMDTLAPNDYAAMVAMPTTSFYNDVKAIDNRLAARHGPIDENARWEFFAQAQGTFIENDDARDTQTFDFDLYGVLAGADYRVNEGLTVGVTVGYDYGKADIHNSGGKIESDDVRITVFAGQQIGEMFFVNAGAQVGYGHYEAKRKTAYGDAKGDTDGWNAGLFADVGMMLTLSEELKIAARPYVGLAYLHSEVGSFDDNLFDVDDFHGDSLRASIGCGLFWGFDLAEAAWAVGLDASYSHDFCGDEVDIDATYMSTGKDFGITAKALSKDIFSVGPTVSVGLTKSIDIFAGYAFQAGTDSSTGHNVNAGLKVTF